MEGVRLMTALLQRRDASDIRPTGDPETDKVLGDAFNPKYGNASPAPSPAPKPGSLPGYVVLKDGETTDGIISQMLAEAAQAGYGWSLSRAIKSASKHKSPGPRDGLEYELSREISRHTRT